MEILCRVPMARAQSCATIVTDFEFDRGGSMRTREDSMLNPGKYMDSLPVMIARKSGRKLA